MLKNCTDINEIKQYFLICISLMNLHKIRGFFSVKYDIILYHIQFLPFPLLLLTKHQPSAGRQVLVSSVVGFCGLLQVGGKAGPIST